MKKNIFLFAVVLLTAFVGVSCSNEDFTASQTPIDEKTETNKVYQFTATLEPKSDEASMRSTLADEGTSVSATWKVGDEIMVTYTNTSEATQDTKATVTAVDGSGKATITASMTNPKVGTDVSLEYPYDFWEGLTTLNISKNQIGTLADIGNNYDFAIDAGTMNVTDTYKLVLVGENVTIPNGIVMKNQNLIWRFNIRNSGDTDITNTVTKLLVRLVATTPPAMDQVYEVNPTSALDNIYVAIPGGYFDGLDITVTAITPSGAYMKKWTGVNMGYSDGKFYYSSPKMTKIEGALPGVFSVSDTDRALFSKGNLQAVIGSGPTSTYNYTASSWSFAEHQWDFVAAASFTVGTTVDLFGWVGNTASYDTYGLCTKNEANNFYYGYASSDKLKSDWGTLAITNGGNVANYGWCTLSKNEWVYLLNTRTTTSGVRYAKAKVNDVNGIIILPDEWKTTYHALTSPNTATANYMTNEITSSDWTNDFEAHGAVFLPAAGYRFQGQTSVTNAGFHGEYWSSSAKSKEECYYVDFNNTSLDPEDYYQTRCYGHSVRLVMK